MMAEEAAGEVARKTLELGSLGQQSILHLGMCLSVNGGEREREDTAGLGQVSVWHLQVKNLLTVNQGYPPVAWLTSRNMVVFFLNRNRNIAVRWNPS